MQGQKKIFEILDQTDELDFLWKLHSIIWFHQIRSTKCSFCQRTYHESKLTSNDVIFAEQYSNQELKISGKSTERSEFHEQRRSSVAVTFLTDVYSTNVSFSFSIVWLSSVRAWSLRRPRIVRSDTSYSQLWPWWDFVLPSVVAKSPLFNINRWEYHSMPDIEWCLSHVSERIDCCLYLRTQVSNSDFEIDDRRCNRWRRKW